MVVSSQGGKRKGEEEEERRSGGGGGYCLLTDIVDYLIHYTIHIQYTRILCTNCAICDV